MLFKKSAKSPQKAFTNEQIRAKAYQIWEENKEQSEEENWNAAIKALERERKFRVLISIWRWTGIGEKKGWDIVTSLSIPLIVFGGGILFNYLNGKQQQEVADQKQKDDLVKTYINDMKGFLLDKDHPLKKSKKDDESRSIARAVTLTTLTQLNSEKDIQRKEKEMYRYPRMYNERKGFIMQFLFESGLIKFDAKVAPIISLSTADFTFANLQGDNLKSANLYRANLESAYLYRADLESAYLYRAYLMDANLYRASLYRANLIGANLNGADLGSANLGSANLIGANLYRANLESANLYRAAQLTNEQIKMACNWEKAMYTEAKWDKNQRVWTAKDKTANQKKIDKIKQDKTSDPAKPPDCSGWKFNF